MALGDPIWREDIRDHEDYVASMTKTLHNLVERAQYQGAPPSLVDRLTLIRNLSAQMLDELKDIEPYFPSEPP